MECAKRAPTPKRFFVALHLSNRLLCCILVDLLLDLPWRIFHSLALPRLPHHHLPKRLYLQAISRLANTLFPNPPNPNTLPHAGFFVSFLCSGKGLAPARNYFHSRKTLLRRHQMVAQQQPLCITDYHIIKTLGAGSTGKVKLARHPVTDELVALKIIRKDLLNTKRNLFTKVHREIAVMKLINGNCNAVKHNNRLLALHNPDLTNHAQIGVLQLLDVYETENLFVLVLEYCNGGELFDLLVQNGYLQQPLVLDLFQQLVYALDFCHKRGICHRDLKPENVLLTSDGRVKLADFGMASLLTPGCLLETSCGSPQYVAPEVILGESYAGPVADVWSLGVVLYAMTTGGLPFDDDNLQRLTSKITSGAFYMPAEVPDDLADLIRSMLTVEPSQRATLDDVKASKWFKSSPPREDIYKEDKGTVVPLQFWDDIPVEDPDRAVLQYLRDLGLGDDPTIRRRLRSEARCLERDFYYQLLRLCGDSLEFQPADDMPPSPKVVESHSPKQITMVGDQQLGEMPETPVMETSLSEACTGPPAPPPFSSLPASWLRSLVATVAARPARPPVAHPATTVHGSRISPIESLRNVGVLRSVSSM